MKQRAPRFSTYFPITISNAGRQEHAFISNVSGQGARVESAPDLNVGDRISFNLLKERIEGIVQWVASGRAGILIAPMLNQSQIDTVRFRNTAPNVAYHGRAAQRSLY